MSTVSRRVWGCWHPHMSPLVLPEMVRSHKLSAALVTFMWSVFGVYPSMSSKFTGTEEGPSTVFPHASIGPFTCVFALVTHEVGVLSISFFTVLIVTVVRP